jgi:glutamine amidotransferase
MSQNVAIIDYGAGNLKSIAFALDRLGARSQVTNDRGQIAESDKVIFPGVGHAEYAMEKLSKSGLDTLIPNLQQPVLGICLGMQLMGAWTEEGSTDGLGIVQEKVLRFKGEGRVPHMGWSKLFGMKGPLYDGIESEAYVYFVHSYWMEPGLNTASVASYMGDFAAGIERNNFYGCQFHPERSGEVGQRILKNFLSL